MSYSFDPEIAFVNFIFLRVACGLQMGWGRHLRAKAVLSPASVGSSLPHLFHKAEGLSQDSVIGIRCRPRDYQQNGLTWVGKPHRREWIFMPR